jgi:hypothetical protein
MPWLILVFLNLKFSLQGQIQEDLLVCGDEEKAVHVVKIPTLRIHVIYEQWRSIHEEATNSVAFSPQSELYRPSDRRLSAKLVPTSADRGCRVVSATDSHGH